MRRQHHGILAGQLSARRDNIGRRAACTEIIAGKSGLQIGGIAERGQSLNDQIAHFGICGAAHRMRHAIAHELFENLSCPRGGEHARRGILPKRRRRAVCRQRPGQNERRANSGDDESAIFPHRHGSSLGSLFSLVTLDAVQNFRVGQLDSGPAQHLDPLARFKILVVLKEMLNLL